jgi:hypothetical protein
MKKRQRVLILGKLPLPVGGVTIHVKRLLENLKSEGFTNYVFVELRGNLLRLFFQICRSRVIHLHLSSPLWQLIFAVLCKLLIKKLIITYHGNWGRYSSVGNLAVRCSARLCNIPIVQNTGSLTEALRCNKRARLISTYLPSAQLAPLDNNFYVKLHEFRRKYKWVVCTNAWRLTFDKDQNETYGISDLIRFISSQVEAGLVVSDPSGTYQKYINTLLFTIPANVLFLSGPHDFRNVLRVADGFFRNTTTDGVSLSIHEALELNVPVLASDKAERAKYCRVYSNLSTLNLETEIREAQKLLPGTKINILGERPIDSLIYIYSELLNLK